MIRNVSAAAVTVLLLTEMTAAAVAGSSGAAPPPRGSVVSAEHVQRLSSNQVGAALRSDSFDASQVRFGVDAYRLVYRTVDVQGRPTTASGLVVLPRDRQRRLRVVAYAHGTMSGRDEAPSVDSAGRSAEGLTFASAGYAAVLPDYLGLGRGPGRHPYMHLPSEVTAELDMLRAADTFAARIRRSFDRRVLVTGFSQGGDVAMAFGQALQRGIDTRYRLAADAPISGPYALTSQELPAAFDDRLDPKAAAFYLAYLLVAYHHLYGLYDRTADVFAAPFDRTAAPLFDGNHDEPEIFAALPATPRQLLTPEWSARLQHPGGRLLAVLQANETACAGWRPAPLHLYAARGDEQVAVGNTYACRRQLVAAGVHSSLIDTGEVGHLDSGRRGLSRTLGWFGRIAPPATS